MCTLPRETRKLIARLEKKRKDAADAVKPLDEKIAGRNGVKGLEEQLQDTVSSPLRGAVQF